MKRILSLFLCLCLLLAGCAKDTPATEPSTEGTTPTTQPSTSEATTDTTPDPTTDTTEATQGETTAPVPVNYNPLTGEALDAPYTGRVFAVTIDNVSSAIPHHGISQADVFFEMLINDYCTRGLALFTNIKEVPSVGPIRSTRYNFTDLALAYDLILYHASASDVVLKDMRKSGINNVLADDNSVGYRDSYRYRQQKYSWEHTLFVKGENAVSVAESKKFDLNKTLNYGLTFAENATPVGGEKANEIEIIFTLHGYTKTSVMKYNAETDKYVFWQYQKEMVDENNGEPEAFQNVIVMLAPTQNDGPYHVADLYGEGEGYFACGGKIVPIKWTHENENDPISFTLADGTPLTLGTGSTYVAVAPTKSPVNIS